MPSKSKFDSTTESKRWMLYVVFGIFLSWLGLWGVIQLEINSTTKMLFFLLLFAAIVTTMAPAVAYLNARFGKFEGRRSYRARFVRQSICIGLCVVIGAWLQMRRVLNLTLAAILMAVFALIETFLITRENPPREG